MLLHTATLLARKEAHEVAAALKRNGQNPAALEQWARGFYAKLRERVVEAFQPAGFAHRRHRGAPPGRAREARGPRRRRPRVDRRSIVRAARPNESERAEALAEAVMDALLQPAPEEVAHAA